MVTRSRLKHVMEDPLCGMILLSVWVVIILGPHPKPIGSTVSVAAEQPETSAAESAYQYSSTGTNHQASLGRPSK